MFVLVIDRRYEPEEELLLVEDIDEAVDLVLAAGEDPDVLVSCERLV